MAAELCTRSPALNVALKPKCPSSRRKVAQSIVGPAIRSTDDIRYESNVT